MSLSSRPQPPAPPAPAPSSHYQFLSRFQIGEIVDFCPLALIPGGTVVKIPCRIERVSFDTGKVMYDLSLPEASGQGATPTTVTGFYEVYPLRNVDSIFVTPHQP